MYCVDYILWRTQTPPWRTASQVFWILFSGWYLFLFYISVAVFLIFTIIGIVFVPKVLQLAIYTFNPIGFQIVSNRKNLAPGQTLPRRHDPHYWFVIVVNIIWFVFLGWIFFLMHLFSALVQLLTIVGIGNAITNVKLAIAMLAPFGRHVQPAPIPVKPVRPIAAPVLPLHSPQPPPPPAMTSVVASE